MINQNNIQLLQFDVIKQLVKTKCYSAQAKLLCDDLYPKPNADAVLNNLNQTNEIKIVLAANGFFPSVEHEDITKELVVLGLDGALLVETQLLQLLKTTEVSNTLIRFLKGKKTLMPYVAQLAEGIEASETIVDEINRIIDNEAQVKSSASPELQKIRKQINEKHR